MNEKEWKNHSHHWKSASIQINQSASKGQSSSWWMQRRLGRQFRQEFDQKKSQPNIAQEYTWHIKVQIPQ